ncbi:class I SAM-dependent DNA methyltransferase [Roseateles amylovorans]|uniref:Nodulation S family protein n=1 Tax=Roseateles amylovorans TaxID=2978473 RepID=A0ABY6B152_9BURK|nr:class I SAM-dependent methyltransferase [Roseateles amylovorans]UXH79127.1 nodulation S family protein [Roseateles amylovorans]
MSAASRPRAPVDATVDLDVDVDAEATPTSATTASESDASAAAQLAQHFETLFSAEGDPWRYRTRWYERRKRALTLACLPMARYAQAFEPACAIGELSAALAGRCDRLLSTDGSAAAVAIARERLADCVNVQVERATMPAHWPNERFDLIVLSEFGYYLESDALAGVIDRSARSLMPGGTILACHWRHAEGDYRRLGDEVHRLMQDGFTRQHGLTRLSRHEEADFLIEVWSDDARPVSQREGLPS